MFESKFSIGTLASSAEIVRNVLDLRCDHGVAASQPVADHCGAGDKGHYRQRCCCGADRGPHPTAARRPPGHGALDVRGPRAAGPGVGPVQQLGDRVLGVSGLVGVTHLVSW